MRNYLLSSLVLLITLPATAQKKSLFNLSDKIKTQALQDIQQHYEEYKNTALQIWDYAELGYKEQKSSSFSKFKRIY